MVLLEKFSSAVNRCMLCVGGVFLVGTMLVAAANMFLRPLGLPITGSFELMGFGSAVITAFALGHSQERRAHIAVNILFRHFSQRLRSVLQGAGDLICCMLFALAAYRLTYLAFSLWSTSEVSETLRIPFYPFVICVALGFWGLSLTLLLGSMKAFSEIRQGH